VFRALALLAAVMLDVLFRGQLGLSCRFSRRCGAQSGHLFVTPRCGPMSRSVVIVDEHDPGLALRHRAGRRCWQSLYHYSIFAMGLPQSRSLPCFGHGLGAAWRFAG
jgi:hypothetical protein